MSGSRGPRLPPPTLYLLFIPVDSSLAVVTKLVKGTGGNEFFLCVGWSIRNHLYSTWLIYPFLHFIMKARRSSCSWFRVASSLRVALHFRVIVFAHLGSTDAWARLDCHINLAARI